VLRWVAVAWGRCVMPQALPGGDVTGWRRCITSSLVGTSSSRSARVVRMECPAPRLDLPFAQESATIGQGSVEAIRSARN
jgi:hypothetical protein